MPHQQGKHYTLIDFLIRVAHTLEVIKTLCTGTDEVKQKTSLFSVQGKNLLGIVLWFLFFCFTSSVPGTQGKCP